MGSRSKDASAKLHEKHQAILADMLRDEENKYCADCRAKGPRWASWNIGVFMCIRCAGIHRNLGVHISRVKSVNLDSWTPEQIETIQKGGNRCARELYEANLPANFRRPQDDYAVEQLIRSKYDRKLYMAKGAPAVSKDTEKKSTSKQTSTKKEKDTSSNRISRSNKIMSVPRPASGRRSPSPQPMKTSPTPATTNSSKPASGNLVNFDSGAPPTRSKQSTSQVDWLTGAPESSASTTTPSLMDVDSQPGPSEKQPSFAFDPGFVSSQQNTPSLSQQQRPSLIPDPGLQPSVVSSGGADVRTSIMSLYSTPQPQYNSYTPQGYPVNAYYYQQQQQAAMRMAQVAQQQQVQVNQVQQQMAQIKLNRPQQPITTGNQSAQPNTAGFGAGGQTLNPHLW